MKRVKDMTKREMKREIKRCRKQIREWYDAARIYQARAWLAEGTDKKYWMLRAQAAELKLANRVWADGEPQSEAAVDV